MKSSSIIQNCLKVIVLGLFVLLVESCGSIQRYSTSVQVLKPQTKAILVGDSSNLAILVSIYTDSRTDDQKTQGYSDDSTLLVQMGQALKSCLKDAPKYQNTAISIYQLSRKDEKQSIARLSLNDIEDLKTDLSEQNILSVEYLKSNITLTQGRAQEPNGGLYNYVMAIVTSDAMFRLYALNNGQVLDEKLVLDTLIYEVPLFYYETTEDGLERLPSLAEINTQVAQKIAKSYAKRISPTWEDQLRVLYSDGSFHFEQAKSWIEEQDWKQAINIWVSYSDHTNTDKAAMACFNLAVASEVMGDFDLAIDWLDQARVLNSNLYSQIYADLLKSRQKEQTKNIKSK